MGKKSLRAKKWFGRGGHQRYAGRPVDVDLLNTTTRASERVPDVTFEVTKRVPGKKKVVEAGTFTRASEETLRQRRIVSVAGRFKGGSAPGGSGAKIEKGPPPPPPPASKPGQDPRAFSVALGVAKAAAKAVRRQSSPEGLRFVKAVQILMEATLTDKDDRADFDEYFRQGGSVESEEAVEKVAAWPHLRKYWPRMRRRICSYCGKRSDPGEPRLLVCGGCGEGRGVGRYCSENCQREHWPEHQKKCSMFHATPHTMLRNKSGRDSFLNGCMESIKNGLTLEEAVEDRLCKSML